MQPIHLDLKRLLELGAVVAIVAIPVALIVATWEPLQPEPRTGRSTVVEQEQAEDAGNGGSQGEAEPTTARERKRKTQVAGGQSPAALATPQH